MKKSLIKSREAMKILIGVCAVKTLDIKLKNKNFSAEEIIPQVLSSIGAKNSDQGVILVSTISRVLKHYSKTLNYKLSIKNILDESDEIINSLDSEVEEDCGQE